MEFGKIKKQEIPGSKIKDFSTHGFLGNMSIFISVLVALQFSCESCEIDSSGCYTFSRYTPQLRRPKPRKPQYFNFHPTFALKDDDVIFSILDSKHNCPMCWRKTLSLPPNVVKNTQEDSLEHRFSVLLIRSCLEM